MLKIGILLAGDVDKPEENQNNFRKMFETLLGKEHFEYESWRVYRNKLPKNVTVCDGWIVSGSEHSAYEKRIWVYRLKHFIRKAYKRGVPTVGVCFGHQVIASALGGSVTKQKEFVLGVKKYSFSGRDVQLIAAHGDQVTKLPKKYPCEIVGTSDEYCKFAALQYGDSVFTIQPHPELNFGFLRAKLVDQGRQISTECFRGSKTEDICFDAEIITKYIQDFLRRKTAKA